LQGISTRFCIKMGVSLWDTRLHERGWGFKDSGQSAVDSGNFNVDSLGNHSRFAKWIAVQF
jgi:hypothetical protein